VFIQRQYE